GRSTSKLRVNSGAVTMKMINSTSITSMYGTTLISDLSLRRLRREMPEIMESGSYWIPARKPAGTCEGRASLVGAVLALQDRAEFFGEGFIAHRQPLHPRGVAVVGPGGRDGHEQADGGGEQRLGNTRRDRGDAGLFTAADHVVHGHHDAEHGTDQTHVRGIGADVGQQLQIAFQPVDLAREGGAHGALRTFQ